MKPNETQLFSIYTASNAAVRDAQPAIALKYLSAAIEAWEAIRPKDQAAPELLAFPDPPAGYSWHNGANLTPGQVGISEGWRLCCKEEQCVLVDEIWEKEDCKWSPSVMCPKVKYDYESFIGYTYRTKAPLPAPKPTADEIEAEEIKAAWFEATGSGAIWDGFDLFERGYKAAKKGIPAP